MKKIFLTICTIAMAVSSLVAQGIVPQLSEKKGQWGYVNPSTGKWVVKPKYEEAGELTKQPNGEMRALVKQKGMQGFINEAGKTMGVGVVFESILPMEGDAMMVTVKGKTGVANYNGEYLIKPEAEMTYKLGSEGWIFGIKDKKGLVAPDGKWTIEPIYKDINYDTPGYFIVDKGGKAGILNRKGEILLEPKDFTSAKLAGDYWLVGKGDKYGLFDANQKSIVIKPEYAEIGDPIKTKQEVCVPVKKNNGKWGIIDLKGNIYVKPDYILMKPLEGIGLVLTDKKGNSYLWDLETLTRRSAGSLEIRENGPFRIFSGKIDGKSFNTVMDSDGRKIGTGLLALPSYYEIMGDNEIYIYNHQGERLVSFPTAKVKGVAQERDKWIYYDIDPKGQEKMSAGKIYSAEGTIISPDMKVYDAMAFNTILAVRDGKKYSVISDTPDLSGVEISEFSACGDKYLNIKSGGKWGLFTVYGKKIYDFQQAYPVQPSEKENIFITEFDGKKGIVSNKGEEIIAPTVERIVFTDYDKYGYIQVRDNKTGLGLVRVDPLEEVIPISRGYDYINYADPKEFGGKTYIRVRKGEWNSKWGLVDFDGNEIYPAVYKDVTVTNDYIKLTPEDGMPTYLNAQLNKFTPTPKISGEYGLEHGKTVKGYNATFANISLHFENCQGKSYTIHVASYLKNGKPAKTTDGHHSTYTIEPDDDDYTFDHYFTYYASGFQVGAYSKQDMYMKFWLVDDATGKEVNVRGAISKHDFYVKGGRYAY